jgi:transposase
MPDATTATAPPRGLTVSEVARRYRVGEDRVRGWIKRGEMAAINTADARRGRPRYVVTPEALERFESGRSAAAPPKVPMRKRRTVQVDFYPDV